VYDLCCDEGAALVAMVSIFWRYMVYMGVV
jgi:hypothetical protein